MGFSPPLNQSKTLVFFVNGKKIEDDEIDPEWTLLHYLRNKLQLCGTKLGCGEGGCGACTVMVSHYDHEKKKVIHYSANACLAPVAAMHGMAVTTVEGIGSTKTRLHAVQKRIAESHGSQCGFCTPGIVMSMYTLLRNKSKPSFEDLDTALQGNLCRCTGYRPILEGFQVFTEEWERKQAQYSNGIEKDNVNGINGVNGCPMGDQCCKNQSKEPIIEKDDTLYERNNFQPYDPSQEPIFPPELQVTSELNEKHLLFKGKRSTWYRPVDLISLLELRAKYPGQASRIVVGNTEVGVEARNRRTFFPVLICPNVVSELKSISKTDSGIRIGAAVTLTKLESVLKNEINEDLSSKTRIFKEVVNILHWFAGSQIRSTASVGGNLMTSSPISDLNQIYLAAGVEIEVQSSGRGIRKIVIDENFFTGYRRNAVLPDEILVAIILPYTKKDQYFHAYKQARRRDDDIAIVNIAVNVEFEPETDVIKHIAVAFGGMAATTVLAKSVPDKVVGRQWNEETLQDIYSCLVNDLPLSPDAPGGMTEYRSSLSLSLFLKVFLAVCEDLNYQLPESYQSAPAVFHTLPQKSVQFFRVGKDGQERDDPVGRPVSHRAAEQQASGEAIYTDDIPHYENELYLALVLSTHSHAYIRSIDATAALQKDGVVAFFSAKDLSDEQNRYGFLKDSEIFARNEVKTQGQVIGAIVAKDKMTAQDAAKLVNIEYEDIDDVIITIEEALQKKSFYHIGSKKVEKGDVSKAFEEADHVLSGEVRTGGQEHFYMETQVTFAVPKTENGEMEIFTAAQSPKETQLLAAGMLGIPGNRIVCRVKRLGGGFGGKESGATMVMLPVVLAAHRLGKPVRCMLDRDDDIAMTGQRHPYFGQYKVGFTKEGKILGVDIKLYGNGGHVLGGSHLVLERAVLHCTNAYFIPNVKVEGQVCKTNIPNNCAFRGFGAPQAMFVAENMIRDIAMKLNRDPAEISELNLYEHGQTTFYNLATENCTLKRCWKECMERSDFGNRKLQVEEFNRQNRWKKRGISVVPTMFGVAFNINFLNQGGALVNIYEDGSVLISHGGAEMGQGIHTKVIQVASRVLGIPHSYIYISETATDKVPNASVTAGSMSSDLYGGAVLDACQTLINRITPFKISNPKGKWENWIHEAYLNRVSLSATGFYKAPNIDYDVRTNTGTQAYNYITYGVACSEVQIDCLTGDHQAIRTDIVMDVGESLNPAIDIGQIEGAFMQGYGMFTLEEFLFTPQGSVLTRGPGNYKIPGFSDIPAEFNVSLLRGSSNPRAIYSSKAVGEPPLFLGSSVLFAIKEAILSARADNGKHGWFRLDAPATAERIRMAIGDDITEKFSSAKPGTFTPFFVRP